MSNKYRKKSIKPQTTKEFKGVDKRIKAYNNQCLYRDFLAYNGFIETGKRMKWCDNKVKAGIIDYKTFNEVLTTCNTELVNTMVLEDKYFTLPYGQGELNFIKYKITPEYINFLYQKTKGRVYIPEIGIETNYRIKINYNKNNARTYTSQFYCFNPSKYFKNLVKYQLENTSLGHRSFNENHR